MSDEPRYAPLGYREIMDEFPRLLVLRSRLQKAGLAPAAAVLPAQHNHYGDEQSLIMGLPVFWGDRYALVVDA